jgi:hypothetical protein
METDLIVQCNMSNASEVPKDELRDRLRQSSAAGTITVCYNSDGRGRGQCCAPYSVKGPPVG